MNKRDQILSQLSEKLDSKFVELQQKVIQACCVGPLNQTRERLDQLFARARIEFIEFVDSELSEGAS